MVDSFRKYKSLFTTTSNTFSTGSDVDITLNSATGLPTDTMITLTFDRVDSAGAATSGLIERIVGTVSGVTFTVAERGADGTTEQSHTSPVVEMVWNSDDWNDALAGILSQHSQTGAHTAITGTSATLAGGITASNADVANLDIADSVRVTGVLDEDTMSSNSAVKLATQQSIKAYVDVVTKTIGLPAGSMSPTTTAGCAAVATVEAGTNDVDYKVLDFDTTTVESAFIVFPMPDGWNGGTITFIPYWTAASGSGTVCFGVKGRAFANDDAIDQAYGTEQTSTDTLITAGDIHIGPASSAITIAGSPAGGQLVQLKITRQTGSDTLGVDARLIGIKLEYGLSAHND